MKLSLQVLASVEDAYVMVTKWWFSNMSSLSIDTERCSPVSLLPYLFCIYYFWCRFMLVYLFFYILYFIMLLIFWGVHKLSQIWLVGALSNWLRCLWGMPCHFFEMFFTFWHNKMTVLILYMPWLSLYSKNIFEILDILIWRIIPMKV